jgi:hypothetical protein
MLEEPAGVPAMSLDSAQRKSTLVAQERLELL